MVDAHHVALSNQFFSKTSRNLAENPRAGLLIVDPITLDQYRLDVEYERTERRGTTFERLAEDVAVAAAMHDMQDVFRLRSADIYRVTGIEAVPARVHAAPPGAAGLQPGGSRTNVPERDAELLAELTRRVSRSADLDSLVSAVVGGLADQFGYEHSILLLADERGERLYTIASHGYDEQGGGLGGRDRRGRRGHGRLPLPGHPGGEPRPDDQVLPLRADRDRARRRGGARSRHPAPGPA